MNHDGSIGGFLGLDDIGGAHYYPDATRFNTARNGYEYILKNRSYSKIYMPKFICDVMFKPATGTNTNLETYDLDEFLDPVITEEISDTEAILYVNYFGLKDDTVKKLALKYGDKLIVDNAQAFFSQPLQNIDTIYSPRKFFGVADGGYLSTKILVKNTYPAAVSYDHAIQLLRRIDEGPENAYKNYRFSEDMLDDLPIARMSLLTELMLTNIDYDRVKKIRIDNYKAYQEHLSALNLLQLPYSDEPALAYPFRTSNTKLRKKLMDNRIYTPIFWPNVTRGDMETHEAVLAQEIIPLPIDQRYNVDDIMKVIRIIDDF